MCNHPDCYFISIIECEETGKKAYVHYDKDNKIVFEEGDLILKEWLEQAQEKQKEKEKAEWEKSYEYWKNNELVIDIAGNIVNPPKRNI
jgi:hypothetical protein